MSIRQFLLTAGLLMFAAPAMAATDVPNDAVWYLHVNFAELRSSETARPIYNWLHKEIVVEVKDEVGVDLGDEVERLTAFGDGENGAVVVVEGVISETLSEAILENALAEATVVEREHRGKPYFLVGDPPEAGEHKLEDLEDGGFLSFAVDGKMLAAASEARLKALLDANGRIAGGGGGDALLILTADKTFVQAGLRAEEFADEADDWGSDIIRNTEQAALMVADARGRIAIEANLTSRTADMAQAIGNIVNGIISLQSFSSELEPGVREVLQNTRVDIDDVVLSIKTVIDPDMLVSILD